jgi:hypothetical protein
MIMTGFNPVKLLCLRSLIYRTFKAQECGVMFQQAFWIRGPPGTGKSAFQLLLKEIARTGWHELQGQSGNFNIPNLNGATFLTLSDIERMSPMKKNILPKNFFSRALFCFLYKRFELKTNLNCRYSC